jgi:hypothetical protein
MGFGCGLVGRYEKWSVFSAFRLGSGELRGGGGGRGGTIAVEAAGDLGEFEASRAGALRVGIGGRGRMAAVQAEERLVGAPEVGLNHGPEFAAQNTVRAADDFLRHYLAHSFVRLLRLPHL